MNRLVQLLVKHGVPLVWANVFLEQLGVPVPAIPTLIVAGAMSRDHKMSSTHVLIAAVIASVAADWIWFALGRRFGYRILRTLCRISLSPDSCVRDTELRFERWGLKSLLIAKFIPGFSTVAPPLAGAGQRSTIAFLIYDSIGALLWAGSGVALGRVFHRAIDRVFLALENLGWWAIVILGFGLVLVVIIKWAQRRGFYRQLRMARVTIDELKEMMERGEAPLVVDARSTSARERDRRRIPSAITVDDTMPAGREIIVYCT
jgi:membrane protein DedA with SNARE-associated domain